MRPISYKSLTLLMLLTVVIHAHGQKQIRVCPPAAACPVVQTSANCDACRPCCAVDQALLQPIHVDFQNVPLARVISDLGRMSGVSMHMDCEKLQNARVAMDQPISLHVENISLKSALNLLLAKVNLHWRTTNNGIEITTHEPVYLVAWTQIEPRQPAEVRATCTACPNAPPCTQKIENVLDKRVTVNFNNVPLQRAIQDLSAMCGANILLDPSAIEDTGISVNTPVCVSIHNVPARAVLDRLLKAASRPELTSVIKDEVVVITNTERAQGKIITVTYPVADLVVPFPGCDNPCLAELVGMGHRAQPAQNMEVPRPYLNPFNRLANAQPVCPPSAVQAGGSPPSCSNEPLQSNSAPRCDQFNHPVRTMEHQLINLITSTIAPESWSEKGGKGRIQYFPLGMSIVVSQDKETQEKVADLLTTLRKRHAEVYQEYTMEFRILHRNEQGQPDTLQAPRITCVLGQRVSMCVQKECPVHHGNIQDVMHDVGEAGNAAMPAYGLMQIKHEPSNVGKVDTIKTGNNFQAKLVRTANNQLRLDITYQADEIDHASRDGIRVVGQRYRIIQRVQEGKNKLVLKNNDMGEAEIWMEVTIKRPDWNRNEVSQPAPCQGVTMPAACPTSTKNGCCENCKEGGCCAIPQPITAPAAPKPTCPVCPATPPSTCPADQTSSAPDALRDLPVLGNWFKCNNQASNDCKHGIIEVSDVFHGRLHVGNPADANDQPSNGIGRFYIGPVGTLRSFKIAGRALWFINTPWVSH